MIASTSCSSISRSTSALVAEVALDQRRLRRDRPGEAGRQVVEDDDPLAGIDQLPDHVAADIAGAAGDQDAHAGTRGCRCRR